MEIEDGLTSSDAIAQDVVLHQPQFGTIAHVVETKTANSRFRMYDRAIRYA
jgi:hypothetical protein